MNEVSFYIPCFNAAKTIEPCLQAVLDQSYAVKEVLVIDDGSTDETLKKVSRYPVKILRHEKNKGLAVSRNTAVKNASAEFIASVDADCIPEKDWLKNLMRNFTAAEVAGVGGKLLEKYMSDIPDVWRSIRMKQYWDDEKAEPPFLFGSNTVFRKSALAHAGFYDEGLKTNYEDVDICKRVKKAGFNFAYDSEAIVYHLRRDDLFSIMNNYWKWQWGYYQQEKVYSDPEKFVFKLNENIGTANRFLQEDMALGRVDLLYPDFFLMLHHSLRDLDYFIFKNEDSKFDGKNHSLVSAWLSLLDLVFFYRYNARQDDLSTFMPASGIFLQNYFALILIVGSSIKEKFKNKDFIKILFQDLLGSFCGVYDHFLLEQLLNLTDNCDDWSEFCRKCQPYLNRDFLKVFSVKFRRWLDDFDGANPGVILKIEISAGRSRITFS